MIPEVGESYRAHAFKSYPSALTSLLELQPGGSTELCILGSVHHHAATDACTGMAAASLPPGEAAGSARQAHEFGAPQRAHPRRQSLSLGGRRDRVGHREQSRYRSAALRTVSGAGKFAASGSRSAVAYRHCDPGGSRSGEREPDRRERQCNRVGGRGNCSHFVPGGVWPQSSEPRSQHQRPGSVPAHHLAADQSWTEFNHIPGGFRPLLLFSHTFATVPHRHCLRGDIQQQPQLAEQPESDVESRH